MEQQEEASVQGSVSHALRVAGKRAGRQGAAPQCLGIRGEQRAVTAAVDRQQDCHCQTGTWGWGRFQAKLGSQVSGSVWYPKLPPVPDHTVLLPTAWSRGRCLHHVRTDMSTGGQTWRRRKMVLKNLYFLRRKSFRGFTGLGCTAITSYFCM